MIEPSISAEYAAAAASQAALIAAPGFEKNVLHACSTTGSLNAISRPPSTTAAMMARIVTTTGVPSRIARMMAGLTEGAWPAPAGGSPGGGAPPAGGEAGQA